MITVTIHISEIKQNVPLDDAIFKRPAFAYVTAYTPISMRGIFR